MLAVDNHAARALLDRHVATLADATLISGGNDETDGNVQVVRRRNGWSVDGHLVEIHPEIGEAALREASAEPGCQVMAAERPQLLVTNLMVASAMLNALWQVVEHGSVPYSEVYLDVTACAARPRRWFRLGPGAQWKPWCDLKPGGRHEALPRLPHFRPAAADASHPPGIGRCGDPPHQVRRCGRQRGRPDEETAARVSRSRGRFRFVIAGAALMSNPVNLIASGH